MDPFACQEGYLSISPNKWSPTDLSKDTQALCNLALGVLATVDFAMSAVAQVTIIRTERIGAWKAGFLWIFDGFLDVFSFFQSRHRMNMDEHG